MTASARASPTRVSSISRFTCCSPKRWRATSRLIRLRGGLNARGEGADCSISLTSLWQRNEPCYLISSTRGRAGSCICLPSGAMHHENVQRARAMHALDAVEFDIAGGRGAGDEGDRASLGENGVAQVGDGFRHEVDDLRLKDNAQMIVWQQGNGASSLISAAVQHNSAGLRNAQRAAGQRAIAAIQLLVAERPGVRQ